MVRKIAGETHLILNNLITEEGGDIVAEMLGITDKAVILTACSALNIGVRVAEGNTMGCQLGATFRPTGVYSEHLHGLSSIPVKV